MLSYCLTHTLTVRSASSQQPGLQHVPIDHAEIVTCVATLGAGEQVFGIEMRQLASAY